MVQVRYSMVCTTVRSIISLCTGAQTMLYLSHNAFRKSKVSDYPANTVKILKFGTPQTIAIIVLKLVKFDVTLH